MAILARRSTVYLGLILVAATTALYLFRSKPASYPSSFSHLGSLAHDALSDYRPAPVHDDIPSVDTGSVQDHKALNRQYLRDLYACLAAGNCGKNQAKVVLLGERWFKQAIDHGCLGGEHVWANTMMRAMRDIGYTYLVGASADDTLDQYHHFPNLVQLVIGGWTLDDWGRFVKTADNPTGIPRWKSGSSVSKSFDMEFFPWGGRTDDLGYEWAVHAERPGPKDPQHRSINYIGYSIENDCKAATLFPSDQRPMTAWFYAKQATYAYSHFPEFGWNRSYFELATRDLSDYGLSFRGAYAVDPNFLPDRITEWPLEELRGVKNLGNIGGDEFTEEIAKTRIVVGIGQPWLAPSAYLALCLGTPFLNVLKKWNDDEPNDRTQWITQHDVLAALDPPYVHNVRAGDYNGFVNAIRHALTHSTPPWIDPEMTEVAVRDRMHHFLEQDWQGKAEAMWRQRDRDGDRPLWVL